MRSIRLIMLSMLLSINALGQDCPTEAQLENTATKTIPTDGSCDSPIDDNTVCNITSSGFFDIDGTTTVLPCVTLNLADAAGFAIAYIPTLRSWSEPVFLAGLSSERPVTERAAIVDDIYGRYERLVAAAPDGHGMDYVHCYMILRKS